MPIVDDTDVESNKPILTPIRDAIPDFKSVTIDTRYIPVANILTHVEGSSWTIDYYSQVLNDDSALSGQNLNRNAIHQAYKLIEGMEVKVTTALTSVQDEVGKTQTMSGVATVYPFLIPNIGDMFIANIGDGRRGIFKVTGSERRSIFKDTCHVIEYQLIDYDTAERRNDFAIKTVETFQFVKDFLMHGQNPLLIKDEYLLVEKLRAHRETMIKRYFKSFISGEFKTLLIPGQPFTVYDSFLTNAVMSMFNVLDTPELLQIRRLNCDGDDVMSSLQIWDVLRNRDIDLLKNSCRKMGLVGTCTFTQDPMFDGVRYSGVEYLMYPIDPELSSDYRRVYASKPLAAETLVPEPSAVRTLADLIAAPVLESVAATDVDLIHEVLEDDCYVFSQMFYDNADDQSRLELCVRDYLAGNAPDNRQLLVFCETYNSWGSLERFYFIPVILMLLNASVRSI